MLNVRYAVPGATGKEVIIFDLYPKTGTVSAMFVPSSYLLTPVPPLGSIAQNIVARHIVATTVTHSPVRVMCNSTTVRIHHVRFGGPGTS